MVVGLLHPGEMGAAVGACVGGEVIWASDVARACAGFTGIDADRLPRAEAAKAKKGWRWIGEMEEIADTFITSGQPEGFHRAAAEVYRA